MKPDTVKRRRAPCGFRVISTIDLPPGRYQLRVGAREEQQKKAGSVVLRPRRPRLQQGEAADEQSGADLGVRARRRRRRGRRIRCSSCCRDRCRPIASSRRPTSSRSSPRSTTTAPSSRTRWTSRRRSRPKAGRRCSRPARSVTAASWRAVRAATASARGFRSRTSPPGLYVLRVEAKSRLGDQPEAARETVIRVRGAAGPRSDGQSSDHRPRRPRSPRCCATACGGSPGCCS